MTDSPELVVLDVGHGSCAVLFDTDATTVVDCAPGSALPDLLDQLQVCEIHHVLISHADSDHIGGLAGLLLKGEVDVRNVYLNPDLSKKTKAWAGLRRALRMARERSGTRVHPSLASDLSGTLRSGQVEIEVLAPDAILALGGVGGRDEEGRIVTTNSMSAVLGFVHRGHRVALLAGDVDEFGLSDLLGAGKSLNANILVFPHHGGHPAGMGSERFAAWLCGQVKPNLVLFSTDRDRYSNPRPEIVKGVKSASPEAHILCTQLSEECAENIPRSDSHLTVLPAQGSPRGKCCGGTVVITLNGAATTYEPAGPHRTFVKDHVPTPMCRRRS